MVRISIPNLPNRPPGPPSALTLLPLAEQAAHLARFLEDGAGRTLVITGAGVSVDSGIRAYRGKEGSYSNPNYKPIFYGELVEPTPRGEMYRKRYWARSFMGYPPVRDAQPNPTHVYVASLQALGIAPGLITQNVDNLHRKALSRVVEAVKRAKEAGSHHGETEVAGKVLDGARVPPGVLVHSAGSGARMMSTATPAASAATGLGGPAGGVLGALGPRILELHGTLARVHCLEHMHEQSRDSWQEQLATLNPAWDAEARDMEVTGRLPRTNPDGDVELPGADYMTFNVPQCRTCVSEGKNSLVKPNVIFFGETLPVAVKNESFDLVASASRLLVLGTSLATYSAFRLIKAAREAGKPVLMISQGPSRADDTEGVEKMDVRAAPVLRAYLDAYLSSRADVDAIAVRSVLDSGVVKKLPDVELPMDNGLIPSK